MIPNFFLVGAPKAGTTSLCRYLDQHPQVYLSPIKEPCHFSEEIRPENFSPELQPRMRREMRETEEYLLGPMLQKRQSGIVAQWESYLKLFDGVKQETAIGEGSVHYLWSPGAARNIAARIPDARILMILRDPAERAYSQYLNGVTAGLITAPFREQVQKGLRHAGAFDLCHPFLEFGMYSGQVKRYLETFPRERVFIRLYEDPHVLPDVLQFLGVDPDVPIDQSARHLEARAPRHPRLARILKRTGIWAAARRLAPFTRSIAVRSRREMAMEPRDRAWLVGYYREDVERLAGILDRDLSVWLK